MNIRKKKYRAAALIAAGVWLLGLGLGCGGSGDEDEETTSEAVAAAPVAPPTPTGPFEQHGAVFERLHSELARLATSQPNAFTGIGRPDRTFSPGLLSGAGAPSYTRLTLQFAPGPGQRGPTVRAEVARLRSGDVRVIYLEATAPQDGRGRYTAPPPIAAVAQTLRLQVMDGVCDLPTIADSERSDAFGVFDTFSSGRAAAVAGNCAAAAGAFQATTLALSSVRVSSIWSSNARSSLPLSSLGAVVDSGAQLRFSGTQFGGR